MQVETFSFQNSRWPSGGFPQLDSEETLVLAFGDSKFFDQPAPIAEIARAYPRSHLLGCSTSGEILGTAVSENSIAVAVAKFASGTLRSSFAGVGSAADSFAAGQNLARDLAEPDLRGELVLSDGLNVNGSELVRGLNSVLPRGVTVTGGLAGDGNRFKRTWVLHQGVPKSGLVSAVGFYGDRVRIGHGSRGGWDIFGPERIVTRSRGNVLYELDGKPALQLYKQYLGERASELPASALLFPLSLRTTPSDSKSLVRTILAVDEESQSMTFAGDIQQGALAQLMKANFERLIQGASDAALMTRQSGASSGPTLAVAISCVGRRLVLGERTEEEVEAVLDILPVGARQVGFYSFGEISPYASGTCDLHNQTMTLTTIAEV
jgi:hypothetical protein